MAEVKQYVCDVCGAVKGETNHWYQIRRLEALHLYRWDFGGECREELSGERLHLCGQACVIRKITEFMGGSNQ